MAEARLDEMTAKVRQLASGFMFGGESSTRRKRRQEINVYVLQELNGCGFVRGIEEWRACCRFLAIDDARSFEGIIGAVEIAHFLFRNAGEVLDAEDVARQCLELSVERFFGHHGGHEVKAAISSPDLENSPARGW
jgi:hypothetical protein